MKVKILGTGCPNCNRLYAEAEKAIALSAVNADLEKVEKIEEILKYGVMAMPSLVIDGHVKSSGRIPDGKEIASWIRAAKESG